MRTAAPSIFETRSASATEPGAGYCIWKSSSGKPPKSWMVFGCRSPVTKVPGTYQCAETERMALGSGRRPASERKPRLQTLSSMAFIGEPWPTKRTGIFIRLGCPNGWLVAF